MGKTYPVLFDDAFHKKIQILAVKKGMTMKMLLNNWIKEGYQRDAAEQERTESEIQ